VDVVICGHPDLTFLVREGDPVYGPKTPLARLAKAKESSASAIRASAEQS
jgi:hypothetical protein